MRTGTQYGALFRGWPGYADAEDTTSYDAFALIGLVDGSNKRAISLDFNETNGTLCESRFMAEALDIRPSFSKSTRGKQSDGEGRVGRGQPYRWMALR